jgi:hypothetical protein
VKCSIANSPFNIVENNINNGLFNEFGIEGFRPTGVVYGCGGSSAPGGRVTHVDIVCEIFGCGILEPDHGRLRLGLRYLRGTRYFSNITRKGGKTVRFLVFGFDGFRLKIDGSCRKKEMTLVLILNYLRFLVSRKITIPSQGGYFRDSVLLSGASYVSSRNSSLGRVN